MESRMPAVRGKSSVLFIFVTILLDSMGLGLLLPVLPDVLRRFSSDETLVSQNYGYFVGVYALMQFLASPLLGSLSDRYGRKPIMLISLLGAGLDYIFMAYAPTLWLLFIGRIISGLTGASMTVAAAYAADVSDDSNRSANFGMIGAALGLGFIVGPLIGGMVGTMGPTAPFLTAAALNLMNFAFGVFVLPESLPRHLRRMVSLKSLNPIASILQVIRPSPYAVLIWIYFLLFLAGQVHFVNWTLYTQMKFGWTAWEVGLTLSFAGTLMAIGQGWLTRIVIPKLGESRSLTFGIIVYVILFALLGSATEGWMMYVILLLFPFSSIAVPALQSMATKYISPERQGEFQGSLIALGSLASIFAPLLFTELFVFFTRPEAPYRFPGAAYIGAAAICMIALLLRFDWKMIGRSSRTDL